jgi:transcriptional regulator with XRE-family HTH domain
MSTGSRLLFARNANKRRCELQLSYGELHRRSGIAVSRISVVLKGKGKITLDTAARLANALDTPLHILLTPDGPPKKLSHASVMT